MNISAQRPPPRYVDLAGETLISGDVYFDSDEFEARRVTEERHYWHIYRNQLLPKVLERVAPTNLGNTIDVGCGVGTVTTLLNGIGYSVDYADVHERALQLAYENAHFKVGPGGRRAPIYSYGYHSRGNRVEIPASNVA